MWRASQCERCGRCVRACEQGALRIADQALHREHAQCAACTDKKCVAACLNDVLLLSGRAFSVPELMSILKRDRDYWGSGGGVTFSGGEPFAQFKYLDQVVRACVTEFIDTCIETSAYAKTFDFLRVMQWLDYAFVDIKHMDDAAHRAGTGVSNGLILHNISMLALQRPRPQLVVRVPVVPGYNDTEFNMQATARFMQSLKLHEVQLLPFHNLGQSKWKQIGRSYAYNDVRSYPANEMDKFRTIFEQCDVRVAIGTEIAKES